MHVHNKYQASYNLPTKKSINRKEIKRSKPRCTIPFFYLIPLPNLTTQQSVTSVSSHHSFHLFSLLLGHCVLGRSELFSVIFFSRIESPTIAQKPWQRSRNESPFYDTAISVSTILILSSVIIKAYYLSFWI